DLWGRECFGPVTWIVPVADTAEALRLAFDAARGAGAIPAALHSTDGGVRGPRTCPPRPRTRRPTPAWRSASTSPAACSSTSRRRSATSTPRAATRPQTPRCPTPPSSRRASTSCRRGSTRQPDMPCYAIDGLAPVVDPTAFVHPTATLIGDVTVGAGVYVGPGASLRGDF